MSPNTTCKSSRPLSLLSWNFKPLASQIRLKWQGRSPYLDSGRVPTPSSPWQTPSFAAVIVDSIILNCGRYLCSWLCWVHCKGHVFAGLVLHSFEVLVFKKHKISLRRYDISLNSLIHGHQAPSSPADPNDLSKVRVPSLFTKSISYFSVS